MYARIEDNDTLDSFIDYAVKQFKKEDPNFKHKKFKSVNTPNKKYIIMDYVGGPYKSYERVFYVQMKDAIGYVVFSARTEADFKKYADSVLEVAKSYEYKPEYINHK